MNLRRRRRAVEAQHLRLKALRRRGEAHVDTLARRTQALWPWFWLGGGALLGFATERELARPPRPRGRIGAWIGALPWARWLPLFERLLVAALLAPRAAPPGPGAVHDTSEP